MLNFGAIVLAAVMAATAPIQMPSQQPPPAKTQAVGANKPQQDADRQQKETKPPPLVVEAHISGKLETAPNYANHETAGEQEQWLYRWLDPISIFTGLLVLVGVGQVYFLRNTDLATTKAAEAAKKSADTAAETLRVSEGPVVSITDFKIQNFGPGLQPQFTYMLNNSGRTAADIIEKSAGVFYGATLPQIPQYGAFPQNIILAPQTKISQDILSGLPVIPVATWNLMLQGQQFIFLYGRITYRTRFDETYDFGFVTKFIVSIDAQGNVAARGEHPSVPGYAYLTKR